MRKFKNLNDYTLWSLEELNQLRDNQKRQGVNVYDSFDEWLDNQLDMNFVEVNTKKFSIPVTWEVWDKIEVEATTIEEAIEWVKENIDEIPLGNEPEYVEGSYKIDDGDDGQNSIEDTVKYLKDYWNLSGGIDGEDVEKS